MNSRVANDITARKSSLNTGVQFKPQTWKVRESGRKMTRYNESGWNRWNTDFYLVLVSLRKREFCIFFMMCSSHLVQRLQILSSLRLAIFFCRLFKTPWGYECYSHITNSTKINEWKLKMTVCRPQLTICFIAIRFAS